VRTRVGAILALVLASTMVACGPGAAAGAPGPTTTGSADPVGSGSAGVPGPLQDKVTIRFGVFPNVTHAPGLVELADGGTLGKLLPEADIQVSAFNSGTKAVEAMFADSIDITFVGPNPAINAYAQSDGQAVRVIAGSTSGGAFLVVKPDISSAEDLRGKSVASPNLGNTQDVALRAWLKSKGLSTDTAGGGDVSIVPQDNAQTLETFQAGTIAGAWVPEPWATRLVDEGGGKVLVNERDLWPDGKFVTTQLMVATKFLQANPEVVKRILLATVQAVDFVNDHPDQAQTIVNKEIEKFTTKALGTSLLTKSWANLTFTIDPIPSSLAKSAQDAESLGLLEDPGDLSGLYDLGPLNDVLRALGKPAVSGL
jgi:NitT/TauT family transport system substrate-binding protein